MHHNKVDKVFVLTIMYVYIPELCSICLFYLLDLLTGIIVVIVMMCSANPESATVPFSIYKIDLSDALYLSTLYALKGNSVTLSTCVFAENGIKAFDQGCYHIHGNFLLFGTVGCWESTQLAGRPKKAIPNVDTTHSSNSDSEKRPYCFHPACDTKSIISGERSKYKLQEY